MGGEWAEQRKLSKFIADWENGTRVAAITSWKCALTLHRYISVTDKVKINEKNNSIVTGPLYVHTDFKTIWTLLPEDVAFLNPMGYRIS